MAKNVILESPYGGDIDANVRYARAAIRDSLERGEAPIASHLLYTQPGILRDEVAEERAWGIAAGLSWIRVAEASVVYEDLGISRGMRDGIAAAQAAGVPVEYRRLLRWALVSSDKNCHISVIKPGDICLLLNNNRVLFKGPKAYSFESTHFDLEHSEPPPNPMEWYSFT